MSKQLLIGVLSLLPLACTQSATVGEPDPDKIHPPPRTGLLETDLAGSWTLSQIEVDREYVYRAQAGDPAPEARPKLGQVLTLGAGRFRRLGGLDLIKAAEPREDWVIHRHVNRYDRRFAFYDVEGRTPSRLVDGGGTRWQFALGTVTEDRMVGMIYASYASMVYRDNGLIRGFYVVRFERVER